MMKSFPPPCRMSSRPIQFGVLQRAATYRRRRKVDAHSNRAQFAAALMKHDIRVRTGLQSSLQASRPLTKDYYLRQDSLLASRMP